MRGLGSGTDPVVLTPGGVRTSSTFSAEAQREIEDRAMAQEMWTRDASAPYLLEYGGRISHVGEHRRWRESDAGTAAERDWLICDWRVAVVNAVCSPDVVRRWVFEADRYDWARRQLGRQVAAKARMPGLTRATAPQWASWVRQTLRYLSLAYWSVGVRAHKPTLPGPDGTMAGGRQASRTWLAWDGPKVDRWRERVRVSARALGSRVGAVGSIGRVDDPTQTGIGDGIMPRVWNEFRSRKPGVYRRADGSVGPSTVVPDDAQIPKSEAGFDSPSLVGDYVALPDPRPGVRAPSPWFYVVGAGNRGETLFDKRGSRYDAFVRWLALTAESSTFGTRPIVVATSAGLGTPADGVQIGGQGHIDFVEAMALDVLGASYWGFMLLSLERWSADTGRMPAYVQEGSPRTAVAEAIATNRAIALERTNQAEATSTTLTSSAGSSSGGGGSIVTGLTSFLYELARGVLQRDDAIAVGSSSIPFCPPPPFLRIMTAQGCDVASLIEGLRTAVPTTSSGSLFTPRLVRMPVPVYGTPKKSGGAVLVGGGFLVAILAALARGK